MSTDTRTAEFKMGSTALLAAALERTPMGALSAAAKRARTEIDRRDAKRDAKVTPVASSAPVAPAAKVTEAVVVDLAKAARKVARAIADSQARLEIAETGAAFVPTKIRIEAALIAEANADPAAFLAE